MKILIFGSSGAGTTAVGKPLLKYWIAFIWKSMIIIGNEQHIAVLYFSETFKGCSPLIPHK